MAQNEFIKYNNTPNGTLPIIWSDYNGWIPLFRRVRRVNGILSYYKQFDAVTKKKESESAETAVPSTGDLSLFVDSKNNEIFFDIVTTEYDLAQLLGFNKINVIPLGHQLTRTISSKLVTNILEFQPNSVFVADSTNLPPYQLHAAENGNLSSYKKFVFLDPSFVVLLKWDEMAKDEQYGRHFQRWADSAGETTGADNDNFNPEALRRFLFRIPLNIREKVIKDIVSRFIDSRKLDEFVEKVRVVIIDGTSSEISFSEEEVPVP